MPKPPRVAIMLDLEWPYKRHVGIFAGTQEYAQKHGWDSIIDEFAGATLEESSVRYDGIIARATKNLAQQAARRKVPVVNVWLSSPVMDLLPGVFSDFTLAGRMRAELLLARGFRNFGAITSRSNRSQDLEVKEFRRVVGEQGYSCATAKNPQNVATSLLQWRKTEKAINDWMKNWQLPIGVFAGDENIGRITTQMCHARGWRVPEDVAIICGANQESLCEQPRPSLSSVELGHERIGYEAARMLDRLMQRRKQPKKGAKMERVLLPPQSLVLRESTDFFAVDDPMVAKALEFIASQGHNSIGPKDVAKAVAAEPRTLQRRFRKYLDRPIAAEIRRVRLERAKRELTQTERSIASISSIVGFGPTMRMYQVFVRELGVTPSQYRKLRQAKENEK